MESHSDPAVGIAGMDKVLREVEIVPDKVGEGGVRLTVGMVGTPVSQCLQLLLGDIVGKDGGVMALHNQLEAVAAAGDMGLHSVPHQYILKLGTQVKGTWIGILSY